jgi:hypothetical protein
MLHEIKTCLVFQNIRDLEKFVATHQHEKLKVYESKLAILGVLSDSEITPASYDYGVLLNYYIPIAKLPILYEPEFRLRKR